MTVISPAWTALLRLARRQVGRNRLRSALIVALIAFPVAAVSAGDVLYRSNPLSAAQRADQTLGGADAQLRWQGGSVVDQSPDGSNVNSLDTQVPGAAQPTVGQLLRLLPRATAVVPDRSIDTLFTTTAGALAGTVDGRDVSRPELRPAATLLAGSWAGGPQQLLISESLADKTGVRVGERITLRRPAASFTVAGVLRYRYEPHRFSAIATPAALDTLQPPTPGQYDTGWTVVQPGGVSWADVRRLNAAGYSAIARSVLLDPPPKDQVPFDQQPQAAAVSARVALTVATGIGLVVLQLALLAGPAFAVSARRRRHDMALLSAIGGDRRTLRRAMLAESIVLGALAAVGGLLLGVPIALTYRGLHAGVLGPLRLRPTELALVAALGFGSVLAGAVLPAHWAARLDVLAALASRRGSVRGPGRISVLGIGSVLTGSVLGVVGVLRLDVLWILPGIALCEVGVIALTPGLLVLVGRAARYLPVAGRMALRDASRNRTAAVPALAAVLAATTASVAIAIYVSSVDARDRLSYQPPLPAGMVSVGLSGSPAGLAPLVLQSVRSGLPTGRAGILQAANCYVPPTASAVCRSLVIVRPAANECPPATGAGVAAVAPTASDARCVSDQGGYLAPILVMTPADLPLLLGHADAQAAAALAANRVVLRDRLDLDGSSARAEVSADAGQAPGGSTAAPAREIHTLPAVALVRKPFFNFQAILSPATAAALRLPVTPDRVLAQLTAPATEAQQQRLTARLADDGLSVYVEHGYVSRYRAGILATLIAAIVVAVGATALATALAVVDSRPDLATLWAVGASPGMRRRLSVARAAVVGVLGVGLGTVIGFIPPWIVIASARRSSRRVNGPGWQLVDPHPLSIPWLPNILATLVLVPLAAMAIAGLMVRSGAGAAAPGGREAGRRTHTRRSARRASGSPGIGVAGQ